MQSSINNNVRIFIIFILIKISKQRNFDNSVELLNGMLLYTDGYASDVNDNEKICYF